MQDFSVRWNPIEILPMNASFKEKNRSNQGHIKVKYNILLYRINHDLFLHMFFSSLSSELAEVYFWGEENFLLSQKIKMFNFSIKYHIKWLIINDSLNLDYIPFKILATKIFIWIPKSVLIPN